MVSEKFEVRSMRFLLPISHFLQWSDESMNQFPLRLRASAVKFLWLSTDSYFSRPTTKSGAQSKARLISESGKLHMDLRAASEYSWARAMATSTEP